MARSVASLKCPALYTRKKTKKKKKGKKKQLTHPRLLDRVGPDWIGLDRDALDCCTGLRWVGSQ